MPSLAQAVIDLAHNLTVNERKTTSRFAEDFYRYTSKEVGAQRALAYTMNSTGMFQDIPLVAPLVKKSLRFSINQDVADAIVRMNKTPVDTLVQALPYAELPHDPVWIEFAVPEGNLKVGWLVRKEDGDLHVHHVCSTSTTNHTPFYTDMVNHGVITKDGFRMIDEDEIADVKELKGDDAYKRTIDFICRPALSVLLLLNSRSNILKATPSEDDYTRLNKARLKNGKEELVSTGTISFDVARNVSNNNLSEKDAAIQMAAALVRGHFKVRATGVFFWSPHVRNAHDENHKAEVYAAEINSERRHTIKTGTASLPVTVPGLNPV